MAARKPVSEDSLKRERAGTYRTADERFTLEGTSSGWLVLDRDQANQMGLPLARGPFATLAEAKVAVAAARSEPAPAWNPAPWRARRTGAPASAPMGATVDRAASMPGAGRRLSRPLTPAPAPAPRPAVIIREIRAVDGDALRALWAEVGFGHLGDDDQSLARLARRNPGLVLVAADGGRVVGSALGAWDGRRGWIYHVATAASHRRQGIATRLVDRVEAGLKALGCPKVNVMVRSDSDGGATFWADRGYAAGSATQYGKELDAG